MGVIGAGVISSQYLENLGRAADTRVVMVADLDPARAASQAAAHGIDASGTPEALIAHDDIEIVVNLTTPAAHVPVSLAAIAASKHVWSEKPLGLDRESGARLIDAAGRAGVRVACAPDTVLGGGIQTARRLLEAGIIGELLTATTQFEVPGPERWHPNPDFLYALGGGPLFDMGPYYVSTLVNLLGPVASVAAHASTATRSRRIHSGPRAGETFPVEAPTYVGALLDFVRGPKALSTYSFQSGRSRAGIVEIGGTEGTLVVPDPNLFDGTVEVWRAGSPEPEVHPAVGMTMTRGAGVVELARAIRADREPRASGTLAFHVLDVLVSIAEAAEHGSRVRIASTTDVPPVLPASWDPFAATL